MAQSGRHGGLSQGSHWTAGVMRCYLPVQYYSGLASECELGLGFMRQMRPNVSEHFSAMHAESLTKELPCARAALWHSQKNRSV